MKQTFEDLHQAMREDAQRQDALREAGKQEQMRLAHTVRALLKAHESALEALVSGGAYMDAPLRKATTDLIARSSALAGRVALTLKPEPVA